MLWKGYIDQNAHRFISKTKCSTSTVVMAHKESGRIILVQNFCLFSGYRWLGDVAIFRYDHFYGTLTGE